MNLIEIVLIDGTRYLTEKVDCTPTHVVTFNSFVEYDKFTCVRKNELHSMSIVSEDV